MTDRAPSSRWRRLRLAVLLLAVFMAGLTLGARAFMNTQPRSWLNIASCGERCYRPSDVAGMLAAAGIVNAPGIVPRVIRESDKCLAVPYPRGSRYLHLVFFPKRDIRDIADLTPEDQPYVMDCFALIRTVVTEQGLSDYRVYTNGPREQEVGYLHFHLVVF